jgi:hypothetical protein
MTFTININQFEVANLSQSISTIDPSNLKVLDINSTAAIYYFVFFDNSKKKMDAQTTDYMHKATEDF